MAINIARRKFIATLGGASLAWPPAARAQQPGKLRTVGYLGSGTATVQSQFALAFAQRMRELGWIEGKTLAIEYRWGEGRNDRFDAYATEFVKLGVDAIVTSASAPVLAAKRATAIIPIVFAANSDPVGSGLVESFNRPGGNITGVSAQSADTPGREIEFLRQLMPGLRRLAIIANATSPGSMFEMKSAETAAHALNLQAETFALRGPDDIAGAFDKIAGHADGIYAVPDPLISTIRPQLIAMALRARLPSTFGSRDYVEAGGLMSYGANITDSFRHAADFVDKILHGARPADLPVEQPTKFEFVINRKTAESLGLAVPPNLVALADKVIE
jgi:putative tryptophan/tyrosine transport system substrate-binding protein